ncbi:MAG: ribonuclease E/G [Planctomycetaceae bacterium]
MKDSDREERGQGQERSLTGGPPAANPASRTSSPAAAELLVQVIKEGLGSKGPTLSTYISIEAATWCSAGLQRVGVRPEIERRRARKLHQAMRDLDPPAGLGFIVRTAGIDRTRKDLQRDMHYLLRLWRSIVRRVEKMRALRSTSTKATWSFGPFATSIPAEIRSIQIDAPPPTSGLRSSCRSCCPSRSTPSNFVRREGTSVPQVSCRERDQSGANRKVTCPGRQVDRN